MATGAEFWMRLLADWVWGPGGVHGVWVAGSAGLGMWALKLRHEARVQRTERWRERRIREELEAYAGVDVSLTHDRSAGADPMEAARRLARRVTRTIAEKSTFTRVALLLRDREGRMVCVGSVGTDDVTVAALHGWGEAAMLQERSGRLGSGAATRTGGAGGVPAEAGTALGARSLAISLGDWTKFDPELNTWKRSGRRERRHWRRGIVAPIRIGGSVGPGGGARSGRLVGAIAVCADGERLDGPAVDGVMPWTGEGGMPGADGGLLRAIGPIETLADRLAAAMESDALAERLLKTEKLAGLGQLAGGVAHALNNPLTAVLGFAELIGETAADARVRKDAATILQEARKMQDTVARLVDFWRPANRKEEPVEIAALLRSLANACAGKLQERGVKLQLAVEEAEGGATVPAASVRGSAERLRQVFEHLLNNAAQAIATARPREEGEEHTIRVTAFCDEGAMHVIVSDTGPGFREPGRVFDPFYTTREPEGGAGLGLSICYGIVREHGGEISAFNLHPHGAAVVVELPLRAAVADGEAGVVMAERDGTRWREASWRGGGSG